MIKPNLLDSSKALNDMGSETIDRKTVYNHFNSPIRT